MSYDVAGEGGGGNGTEYAVCGQNGNECSKEQRKAEDFVSNKILFDTLAPSWITNAV